jgi:hypothetical protein
MMKKIVVFLMVVSLTLGIGFIASASTVNLYLDSAPNAYGSPNYDPWWTTAKTNASAGSFVNMANGINPLNVGTTYFEIQDVVVYSFGDLGKRLHWIYWVPGETTTSLTAKNFQIAMDYVWDGITYDFYDEYYGSRWLTPSRWENYNNGVIGSAGFAWWGAYEVNTPEALAADLAAWDPSQGNITLSVRMDGYGNSLTAYHPRVPEPSTMLLLGLGLVGLAGIRRKFKG